MSLNEIPPNFFETVKQPPAPPPIPPTQPSGDHLTSESVISHHVCHIKISHGETSLEKYETQKTLPFLTVMYFLASCIGKVCPLFSRPFFFFGEVVHTRTRSPWS